MCAEQRVFWKPIASDGDQCRIRSGCRWLCVNVLDETKTGAPQMQLFNNVRKFSVIKPPLANAEVLRDGDFLLFVCLFVCRLWTSFATWQHLVAASGLIVSINPVSIQLLIRSLVNPSLSTSPLSASITPSLFHSRLKTYLFNKSYPP